MKNIAIPTLGVLLLTSFAPTAEAFAGRHGGQDIPEEARTELRACKENNETHEDRKTCAEAVAQSHGFELPAHRGRRGRRGPPRFENLTDEAREDLRACRAEETREERRACMEQVKEEHGLERSERQGRRNVGQRVRNRLDNQGVGDILGILRNLSEDQRINLLEQIRTLLEQYQN